MNVQLRQHLHAYTSRRSPWGPPWWIYGVAFGAANVVRQAVIILVPAEIPQPIRVASYVLTALTVVVIVNVAAVTLQRRDPAHRGPTMALAPIWPLRRPDARADELAASPARANQPGNPTVQPDHAITTRPPKEDTAMRQQRHGQATTSTAWAPWWLYLVIIIGVNTLRRAVLPDGSTPATRVVTALAVSAVLFVVITMIYRAVRASSRA